MTPGLLRIPPGFTVLIGSDLWDERTRRGPKVAVSDSVTLVNAPGKVCLYPPRSPFTASHHKHCARGWRYKNNTWASSLKKLQTKKIHMCTYIHISPFYTYVYIHIHIYTCIPFTHIYLTNKIIFLLERNFVEYKQETTLLLSYCFLQHFYSLPLDDISSSFHNYPIPFISFWQYKVLFEHLKA